MAATYVTAWIAICSPVVAKLHVAGAVTIGCDAAGVSGVFQFAGGPSRRSRSVRGVVCGFFDLVEQRIKARLRARMDET